MKPLRWILTAAASVVIGLILTSWLSRPIDDFFRGDRIEAELVIGPWHPFPTPREAPRRSATQSDELSKALAEAERAARLAEKAAGPTSLAKLSLSNKSEKVISNIRVKIDSASDVFLDTGDDKTDKIWHDVDTVDVPDMKPGDELEYYIWSKSYGGPEMLAFQLETYSSTGSFRLHSSWPKERQATGFDQFMEEWAGVVIFVTFLFLTILFGGVAIGLESKIKGVLGDEALYQIERDRFKKDPAKYNPLEASSAAPPPS